MQSRSPQAKFISAYGTDTVRSIGSHDIQIGSLKESIMHAYLAALVRDRDWECYRVGGVADHVHLAFSVGYSQLPALVDYIKKQEEHHRSRTFQEEYRDLLEKTGVDFDEKYVWG